MDESKKNEVFGYLKRLIPDISRKCGVMDDDVINVMKTIINEK
jgi:hypothetical protein